MIIRRLLVPLTFVVVAFHAGHAIAQTPFPAPLPGQANDPANRAEPVFPPANGTASAPAFMGGGWASSGAASNTCMSEFTSLREEAEKRGRLIKAASGRKAGPEEACKLIASFGQAERQMIKYLDANASKCGIAQWVGEQLKGSHKNTEKMQTQVCAVARRLRRPAGPTGDFWPVSGGIALAPEARREPVGDFDHLIRKQIP